MSKKTNKKQVGAKAKRAKGAAEAQTKSAKPKDGMSLGAKVALTVFAVLMALSMMLPSIAAIVGTSSSQDSSSQSQSADSGSSADSSDSDSSSDSSDGTTDAVAQADEKYQPLVDALEAKLSSDPQNLATLLNLGKDYMAWGVTVRYSGSTSHANELLEKAISYYDQYLALKDSGAVRVDRALCQYYEEETSEATQALEQLTQDMPDYGPAWANLGMLYESAGNSDQAREAYQKAQEADADDEYGAKTYATQRISAMDSAASSSAGTTDSTSATTSGSSTTGSTGVKGLSDTLANLSGTSL